MHSRSAVPIRTVTICGSSPSSKPWAHMWRTTNVSDMASATPELPSQPQGITAHWLAPNYTAWWQRHMCVNNLPRVAYDSWRLGFKPATCWLHVTWTRCSKLHCSVVTGAARPVFDLKASLARPLTWTPHRGKLKPFTAAAHVDVKAVKLKTRLVEFPFIQVPAPALNSRQPWNVLEFQKAEIKSLNCLGKTVEDLKVWNLSIWLHELPAIVIVNLVEELLRSFY